MEEHIAVIIKDAHDVEIAGEFVLNDVAPIDPECVLLSLRMGDISYDSIKECYFDALLEIRTVLEKEQLKLICNGSAKNVYPSPMLRNMGTGRQAYKLQNGVSAQINQVVDIFASENSGEYATVSEQAGYYAQWLKSLK